MANLDMATLLNIIDIMGWIIVVCGILCLVLIVAVGAILLANWRWKDGK